MRGAVLGLALLLAACGGPRAPLASGPLSDHPVTRPGEVLIVRTERLAELRALPLPERERLCGEPQARWRSPRPRLGLYETEGYGTDTAAEPFAWTVMQAAARGFGTDDAEARAALVAVLRRWARAEALAQIERGESAPFYSLNRVLLPTIVAFALLADAPELKAKDRAVIERWLAARVADSRRHHRSLGPREVTARNNHAYLAASVAMAWGALTGDDAAFRDGIVAYRTALGQMRADGSLPLETARGARALWYQRHAVASLVTIAEMAAVQGYDLYALEEDGRSVHTAVRFLLDAIEEPARVLPYARANVNPGPSDDHRAQDLGFLVRRGHGRHYMAWAEPYRARFPDRAESRRLAALLAAHDPGFRPMIDEYAGGNTSCLFAR